MANVKISALAAYGTEHGDDLIPILDVHDTSMAGSGTDKGATVYKIFGSPSTGQILAWSGSSTGVPVGLSSLTWDGTNIVCAAPFHTQTGTSSEIAAIFKGRSGQSVDLVQIQDSSAGILANINAVGVYKGPRAFAYASKTGTYVATMADGVIACNATSGAFAVTLPAESTVPTGFELIIEKTDASANAITVTAAGSDLINGSATYVLSAVYQYVRVTADGGGNWIINGAVSSGGGGTVTSVTFTGDGTVLSSTPSGAVTSSGTVTASLVDQTAHYVLAGPTSAGPSAPTFRALATADLPVMVASGSSHAAGIVPDPGVTSGTTKFLREDATWAVPPGSGGGGTVTSVAFAGDGIVLNSMPTSPITDSGTLTAVLNTQTAHYVLAGPTSAGPSAPTFRALLAGDLPVLGNTAAGIAPSPDGADNTKFLRADATWAAPLSTSGVLYSQVASVSVTTTNDTSFVNTTGAVGSVVLASGYLTAGKALRFRFGGYCATASTTGNWKLGVFFGSTCIATTGTQPPPANNATYMPWQGEILLVCTVGGGAGTSNIWSSGKLMIYQSVPVVTGFWGIGPASSFGVQSNGAALSPNLSTGITLDIKANSSGTMTFQNWTLTHLIIENLG